MCLLNSVCGSGRGLCGALRGSGGSLLPRLWARRQAANTRGCLIDAVRDSWHRHLASATLGNEAYNVAKLHVLGGCAGRCRCSRRGSRLASNSDSLGGACLGSAHCRSGSRGSGSGCSRRDRGRRGSKGRSGGGGRSGRKLSSPSHGALHRLALRLTSPVAEVRLERDGRLLQPGSQTASSERCCTHLVVK
jgi:hypothetical protein